MCIRGDDRNLGAPELSHKVAGEIQVFTKQVYLIQLYRTKVKIQLLWKNMRKIVLYV